MLVFSCPHSVRWGTAFGVCSWWVRSLHSFWTQCEIIVCTSCTHGVLFFCPSTVSGVEGEVRTQTAFNLGPGRTGTSGKRGTKMRASRSSDCKSVTTPKTGGKKQGQSERSGIYTKEKVSVHHSATESTGYTISPATGACHPSTQVNHYFV